MHLQKVEKVYGVKFNRLLPNHVNLLYVGRMRRMRCGVCQSCLSDDCGKCKHCVDKP